MSFNVKLVLLLNVNVNVIVLLFVLDIYGNDFDIDRVSGDGGEYGWSTTGLFLPTKLKACIDRLLLDDILKLFTVMPLFS